MSKVQGGDSGQLIGSAAQAARSYVSQLSQSTALGRQGRGSSSFQLIHPEFLLTHLLRTPREGARYAIGVGHDERVAEQQRRRSHVEAPVIVGELEDSPDRPICCGEQDSSSHTLV